MSIFDLGNFITKPPFRSKNKIKHILKNEFDETISDADLFFTGPPKLNNININKAKKEYSHKAISIPGGYIGDLMFPMEDYQQTIFLIVIEINTRKTYAVKIPNKTATTLINAFETILEDINTNGKIMRIIRFDEERSIRSKQFQNKLIEWDIEFQPIIHNQHTSTSVIDRVINTIRNIAFNLGIDIDSQDKMDLILNYYNNAPHKTLSKVILQAEPRLKLLFKYGITPNEVYYMPELEQIFVKECMKHNINVIKNKENIIGELCRLYNKYEGQDKFKKKRSKLTTDIYRVDSKNGYLYKCIDVNNGNVRYAPRYEIKLLKD